MYLDKAAGFNVVFLNPLLELRYLLAAKTKIPDGKDTEGAVGVLAFAFTFSLPFFFVHSCKNTYLHRSINTLPGINWKFVHGL